MSRACEPTKADDRRQIPVRLEPELYKAFRLKCIHEGRTMTETVTWLIEGYNRGDYRIQSRETTPTREASNVRKKK